MAEARGFTLSFGKYIIATTHRDNQDYQEDRQAWGASIDHFSEETVFDGLKILEFIDGEREVFVSFEATLSGGMLKEKSRFLKVENRWLYVDGVYDFS